MAKSKTTKRPKVKPRAVMAHVIGLQGSGLFPDCALFKVYFGRDGLALEGVTELSMADMCTLGAKGGFPVAALGDVMAEIKEVYPRVWKKFLLVSTIG